MKRHQTRLGSKRRDGRTEVIASPFDGEPVGEVVSASASDIDDAIEMAQRAFPHTRTLPTHAKTRILSRIAEAIEARSDALATLMARESGKPIRFCRAEVARAVVTFRTGAAVAHTFHGEVLPIDLEPRAENTTCWTVRVPRGPVAAISPFNFPLNLVAHKLAPAFAVGAPVVLKPPPQCPLTAFALGELCDEAGLPPEALSIVHCEPAVAQRMVEDDRMKVLSFTGSDTVGWKLKTAAGKKQVLLELGGNAPCVIDQGIDLEEIVDRLVLFSFANAGQVCIKIQRIFVHASVFEELLGRFVTAAEALPCGDPLDEATVVGPLIDASHVERVRSWVGEALAGGARLHCGGQAEGNVLRPTVLSGTKPTMRVCKDEVFGPVVVIEPFDDFDQAIDACNASRFGLQAGVFTHDLSRAMRAFRRLEYGGVMINEVPTFRVDNFPYGGMKDSGFGREGVRYAMEEMTEPKVMVIRE